MALATFSSELIPRSPLRSRWHSGGSYASEATAENGELELDSSSFLDSRVETSKPVVVELDSSEAPSEASQDGESDHMDDAPGLIVAFKVYLLLGEGVGCYMAGAGRDMSGVLKSDRGKIVAQFVCSEGQLCKQSELRILMKPWLGLSPSCACFRARSGGCAQQTQFKEGTSVSQFLLVYRIWNTQSRTVQIDGRRYPFCTTFLAPFILGK